MSTPKEVPKKRGRKRKVQSGSTEDLIESFANENKDDSEIKPGNDEMEVSKLKRCRQTPSKLLDYELFSDSSRSIPVTSTPISSRGRAISGTLRKAKMSPNLSEKGDCLETNLVGSDYKSTDDINDSSLPGLNSSLDQNSAKLSSTSITKNGQTSRKSFKAKKENQTRCNLSGDSCDDHLMNKTDPDTSMSVQSVAKTDSDLLLDASHLSDITCDKQDANTDYNKNQSLTGTPAVKKRGRPPRTPKGVETTPKTGGRPPKKTDIKEPSYAEKEDDEDFKQESLQFKQDTGADDGENKSLTGTPAVKKRGRPPKTPKGVKTTPKSGGRPPKKTNIKETSYAEKEDDVVEDDAQRDEDDDKSLSETPTVKKGKGRPPKTPKSVETTPRGQGRAKKKKVQKSLEEEDDDIEKDAERDEDDDKSLSETPTVKKGKGRPPRTPKSVETTPRGQGRAKKKKVQKSLEEEDDDDNQDVDLKCQKCIETFEDLRSLKLHYMKSHSALWSKDCPEGLSDKDSLKLIFRKYKKLLCDICHKYFSSIAYFIKHREWCGTEKQFETKICPKCSLEIKVLWYDFHERMHERKEAQQENMKMKKKDREEREEEEDDRVKGKKKRKAADVARNVIRDLKEEISEDFDEDDDDEVKFNEKDEDDDDDDEDDDDDDDDDDNNEEGEEEDGRSKEQTKTSKSGGKSKYFGPTIVQGVRAQKLAKDITSYLQEAQKGEKFSFVKHPEFIGSRNSWQILKDPEELYRPREVQSLPVVIGDRADPEPLCLFQTVPQADSLTIFVGGPVWGLGWAPSPSREEQCLAVAVHLRMEETHLTAKSSDGPGMVQFWRIPNLKWNKVNQDVGAGMPICLTHNYGAVFKLAWCPGYCYQLPVQESNVKGQLGLVAMACTDGCVHIHSIPHLDSLPTDLNAKDRPAYLTNTPVLTLKPFNYKLGVSPACTCIAWQENGDRFLAGFGNGMVCVWNLKTQHSRLHSTLSDGCIELLPIMTMQGHSGCVITCAWSPHLPNVVVTASLDRTLYMWDLTNQDRPLHQDSLAGCSGLHWSSPNFNFFSVLLDNYNFRKSLLTCHHYGSTEPKFSMDTTIGRSTCSIWDIDASSIFRYIVFVNAIGEVKFTFNDIYEKWCLYFKLPRQSMTISKVRVIGRNNQKKSKAKKKDTSYKGPSFHSYQEAVENIYLQISEGAQDSSKEVDHAPNLPIPAYYRVAVNPNMHHSLWVAFGGQSGLLRIENMLQHFTTNNRKTAQSFLDPS